MMHDRGPGRGVIRDMDGAAADDRAAAGASAEFRQSHSYRHNRIPVPGARMDWPGPVHRG
jgi:hypothetical protein